MERTMEAAQADVLRALDAYETKADMVEKEEFYRELKEKEDKERQER